MAQVSRFQVKAMLFQVAEHLLNPHPQTVELDRCLRTQQVGCQIPGFCLPRLPMQDQMSRIRTGPGQQDTAPPNTHPGLEWKTIHALPSGRSARQDQMMPRLPQGIIPAPEMQIFNQQRVVELAVADQTDLNSKGQQA